MSANSSAPATALPDPAVVAASVGPLYVGVIVSWLLMGIYVQQLHHYFVSFKDPVHLRVLVIFLSVLEIVQWIVVTNDAWYYLVTIWGNLGGFLVIPWEAPALVFLCGLCSLTVQSYYVWRIWILSNTIFLNIIAIIVEALALMQSLTSMTAAGFIWKTSTEVEVARRHRLFSLWLVGSFVTDTLIALCMLWILFRAKKITSLKGTDSLLNKLIMNTVRTGTMTSVVAGVTLALFDVFPDQVYYGASSNCLQKFYSISLLASLNSRKTMHHTEVIPESISLQVQVSQRAYQQSESDTRWTTSDLHERV